MSDDTKILRAFAAAGIIAGARLAQHDGMVGGVFGGPPDGSWGAWIEDLAKTLKPLGEDGALICYALTHLAEGAGYWLMFETTAQLNRAMGAVIKRSDGSDLPGGAVEYGDNDSSCYPGMGADDEAGPLWELLDPSRRYHFGAAEREDEDS
ncbi:MAG: hypothetical protein ABIL09_20545 [Gemmatimonadota bacterium]